MWGPYGPHPSRLGILASGPGFGQAPEWRWETRKSPSTRLRIPQLPLLIFMQREPRVDALRAVPFWNPEASFWMTKYRRAPCGAFRIGIPTSCDAAWWLSSVIDRNQELVQTGVIKGIAPVGSGACWLILF